MRFCNFEYLQYMHLHVLYTLERYILSAYKSKIRYISYDSRIADASTCTNKLLNSNGDYTILVEIPFVAIFQLSHKNNYMQFVLEFQCDSYNHNTELFTILKSSIEDSTRKC